VERKASTRLYYLDWLRVLGILAVFVYHSTRFFNLGDWHIKNPATYEWLEIWDKFAVIWMMPLMFLISGASLFFTVGKSGAGKFVKEKVLRLLVPLLVSMFTLSILQVYLERYTHGQFSGSFFQFLPHYFQGHYDGSDPTTGNFAWTGIHLWYLAWLFVFTLILYPLMRWLKGRGQGVLLRAGNLFALPGAVYGLAVPTILLAIADPQNPVIAWQEAGWSLVIYLWLVLCGFLVISSEWLLASVQRWRWPSLALAVVSMALSAFLAFSSDFPSYGTARYAGAVGLRALSCWCWVLAFLGFARRYLNYSTPAQRYANEAVLPFYILHQPVLLCVGYFVVQWALPDLLKWAVILVASLAIIMLLYEFLVRRYNVMRFLLGMKPLPKVPIAQPQESVSVSGAGDISSP
jgi:glucan biosynthesis protein C